MRYYPVRPSKSFLYNMLGKILEQHGGSAGLDAAASKFKNRRMFRTARYYGLDIDREALQAGLARHPDDNAIALLGNLACLDAIPTGSISVVVTTNTLYHLPPRDRRSAVRHLARVTAPDGILLCEFGLDAHWEALVGLIEDAFDRVDVLYYGNRLSRAYERIFERDGHLGDHPIAGRSAFRRLAYLIGGLERFTARSPRGKTHAFVQARAKKSGERNEFRDENLTRIHDRLFSIDAGAEFATAGSRSAPGARRR